MWTAVYRPDKQEFEGKVCTASWLCGYKRGSLWEGFNDVDENEEDELDDTINDEMDNWIKLGSVPYSRIIRMRPFFLYTLG